MVGAITDYKRVWVYGGTSSERLDYISTTFPGSSYVRNFVDGIWVDYDGEETVVLKDVPSDYNYWNALLKFCDGAFINNVFLNICPRNRTDIYPVRFIITSNDSPTVVCGTYTALLAAINDAYGVFEVPAMKVSSE